MKIEEILPIELSSKDIEMIKAQELLCNEVKVSLAIPARMLLPFQNEPLLFDQDGKQV